MENKRGRDRPRPWSICQTPTYTVEGEDTHTHTHTQKKKSITPRTDGRQKTDHVKTEKKKKKNLSKDGSSSHKQTKGAAAIQRKGYIAEIKGGKNWVRSPSHCLKHLGDRPVPQERHRSHHTTNAMGTRSGILPKSISVDDDLAQEKR